MNKMSNIIKVLVDNTITDRTTWWVILECGHWYHWTGDKAPHNEGLFPCLSCSSIHVVKVK